MRELAQFELVHVSGGCDGPTGDHTCTCPTPSKGSKRKGPQGNNGFGNNGADGVPGRSGSNNSPNAPQKSADKVR